MSLPLLSAVPLFAGLPPAELELLHSRMRTREFQAGQALCREGEPGDSLFVIASGLALVTVGEGAGAEELARLRVGDVLGEMSLLTGEPRSATVVAAFPTLALELDRPVYADLLARHPPLLGSLVKLLRDRLVSSNRHHKARRRYAAALVVGDGASARADEVLAAVGKTRVLPLTTGDLRLPDAGQPLLDAVETTDVLAIIDTQDPYLPSVLDHVDRAVFVGEDQELAALQTRAPGASRLVRSADAGWLGRYLARTRLGLALGAGGARGYAHVGVLGVLAEHGYRPDAVAGSSIGAVVGACVAMGMDPPTLEATLRRLFTPETVAALFRLSLGPSSPAMALWTRLLREVTEDRAFSDLALPLVVMCVDLERGEPAPLTEGPLWQALLATTALPGLAPPVQRGSQRLVDGLALVPVPTRAVESQADLTVAVNLMSRDTLPAWPGEDAPSTPRGNSALDNLLEAMELTHVEVSTQHTARADVPITPRFGPSTWKDFHRADPFLRAGREAAEAHLEQLAALVRPSRETP